MPLTNTAIRKAKPAAKPVKMYDARGMYLLIAPAGGKWWRFRYRLHGKHKTLSLGVYPDVTLKMARKRRDHFRALLADGGDPSQYAKSERAARLADEARQLAATRFMLDNDGALTFHLGNRRLTLTSAETGELRVFLDATRAVTSKVTSCP